MSLAPMSRPLLLVTALMILGGIQAGDAAPEGRSPQGAERRQAMLRQQAEAISRLSDRQRQEYFTELEQLEQRRSRDRLQRLAEARRCIGQARDPGAIEGCQRALEDQRQQQRRRMKAELAELRQRFGLPARGGRQRDGRTGTQGV